MIINPTFENVIYSKNSNSAQYHVKHNFTAVKWYLVSCVIYCYNKFLYKWSCFKPLYRINFAFNQKLVDVKLEVYYFIAVP